MRSKCVNMKGVAVVRIRHGTGASKETLPDVSLYTGGWHLGAKTDQGVEVSKGGVFEGKFKKGRRVGRGFFHGYDGTRYGLMRGVFLLVRTTRNQHYFSVTSSLASSLASSDESWRHSPR